MFQLDHVVIAAPDLAAAKTWFADATGTVPVDGGPHVGLGTRNALVSFGAGGQYLEIIAPDPEQKAGANFGGHLAQMDAPRLLHWAVRVTGLPALRERLQACGLAAGDIRRTSRKQPDGNLLVWELMGVSGHNDAGFVPFFIDWLDCPHPATTSPVVGALQQFNLHMPAGHPLHTLLDGCAAVSVSTGAPALEVSFASSRGPVRYQADTLPGFRM